MSELGRLRWQCRRGMLELDLILLQFVEHTYTRLPKEDQDLFLLLLQEEDAALWQWVRDPKSCPVLAWQPLLAQLYAHEPS